MKKILSAILLVVASVVCVANINAQQPQTGTAPLSSTNTKYNNGVGTGYWPTKGAGLVLNVAAGTSFCAGSITEISATTVNLTDNSTNYVYLDSTCTLNLSTVGFAAGEIPIAVVSTVSGAITAIDDVRTMFMAGSGGSGGCGPLSDPSSTDCGTANNVGASYPGTAFVQTYGYTNGANGTKKWIVAVGNNNIDTNTSGNGEAVGIGDTNVSNFGTAIHAQDTIGIGDNSVQSFASCSDCIGIGDLSLQGSGTESYSDIIAIGDVVAEGLLDGSNALVCIGLATCEISNGLTGIPSENIGIGDSADDNDTGSENIAIGDSALDGGCGGGCGVKNNTGGNNIAIGFDAIRANSTGGDNVAIGDQPGCVGCTGGSNGNGNRTGSNNIWIGHDAGQSVLGTTEIDDSIAIGLNAQNTASDQAIFGGPATVQTMTYGYYTPGTIFSAAGTPVPACTIGLNGTEATVSDATAPTYHGTYTSGGAIAARVICDGGTTTWLTE